MTKRRKGNKKETQFRELSVEEVRILSEDPEISRALRGKAVAHLKALGRRNQQKRNR